MLDVQMRGGRTHRANSLPGEVEEEGMGEEEEVEKEEVKVMGGLSRFKSRSMYKINELSQEGSAHIRTNYRNFK